MPETKTEATKSIIKRATLTLTTLESTEHGWPYRARSAVSYNISMDKSFIIITLQGSTKYISNKVTKQGRETKG